MACSTDSRLAKLGHARLALELEERIVQLLIVDVHLAHLRLNPLSCLLSQGLALLLRPASVPLLANTSVGDPRWEKVWRLLDTPLSCKVVPLGVPVRRDGYGIPIRLERDEQTRITRVGVKPFYDFWPVDQLLQLGDREFLRSAAGHVHEFRGHTAACLRCLRVIPSFSWPAFRALYWSSSSSSSSE